MEKKKITVRSVAVCGVMGAVSFVLMLLSFKVPFMPSFISFDVSELPALIVAFALGPVHGILVCLIKNLLHLLITSTLGVGELSNFLLGSAFVCVAGAIYRCRKSRVGALIGSVSGAAAMAVIGVLTNYFIVYPIYSVVFMPKEAILGMYSVIYPVDGLFEALIIFNLPFTFVKGLIVSAICFIIYKKISPIIKNISQLY